MFFVAVGSAIICSNYAEAAVIHYVRSGASGNQDGTSWTDAWTNLPSSISRGDTYYIASGSYATTTIFSADIGTSTLFIRKATLTDHGTAQDWQDAYGAGQAIINGGVNINSPYVDLDGITGNENFEHGIKIVAQNCSAVTMGVYISQNMDNVHVSHVEVDMCGAQPYAQDGIYACNNAASTVGLHLSYLYIHDVSRNGITLCGQAGDTVIEHSRLERIIGATSTPDIHGQGIQLTDAPINGVDIRYNQFVDIGGTAAVALLGNSGGAYSNIYVYDNLFWSSDKTYFTYSPAAIYGRSGNNTESNILVYNNTFYNVFNPNTWMTGATVVNSQNKNNIYVDSVFQFPNGLESALTNPNSTNNLYFNDGTGSTNLPSGESEQVNASTSPFMATPLDFHLATGSEAIGGGSNIGCDYSLDYSGQSRPAKSVWDIGAYEYGHSAGILAPTLSVPTFSSISTDSMVLNGYISDTGCSDAIQSGFAYGTTSDLSFVIATTTLGGLTGTGSFSQTIDNLSPGTTYYIRAYAVNSIGMSISLISSATTPASTTPPVSIIYPAVSSGGGGGGEGGSNVLNPFPMIARNVVTASSTVLPNHPYATTTFTLGTRSSLIAALQTYLSAKGYMLKQYITGYYGSITDNALNRYKFDISIKPVSPVCPPGYTCVRNTQINLVPNTTQSISSSQNISTSLTVANFTRALSLGSVGSEVRNLQVFLNDHGFSVASKGLDSAGQPRLGSPGYESTFFGPSTRSALIKFQDANAALILGPNGLTSGTGYFGTATMKAVNNIMNNEIRTEK